MKIIKGIIYLFYLVPINIYGGIKNQTRDFCFLDNEKYTFIEFL